MVADAAVEGHELPPGLLLDVGLVDEVALVRVVVGDLRQHVLEVLRRVVVERVVDDDGVARRRRRPDDGEGDDDADDVAEPAVPHVGALEVGVGAGLPVHHDGGGRADGAPGDAVEAQVALVRHLGRGLYRVLPLGLLARPVLPGLPVAGDELAGVRVVRLPDRDLVQGLVRQGQADGHDHLPEVAGARPPDERLVGAEHGDRLAARLHAELGEGPNRDRGGAVELVQAELGEETGHVPPPERLEEGAGEPLGRRERGGRRGLGVVGHAGLYS